MKRVPLAFGILGFCVLTASLVVVQQIQPAAQAPGGGGGAGAGGAAGRGGPPPPTNLQVLPKDIPVPELQATMQGIAAGLGVQCTYCHVPPPPPAAGAAPAAPPAGGAAGRGGRGGAPQLDFAADDKQEKKTARVMMKMVSTVNDTIGKEFGKSGSPVVKVECVTCHHGVAKPEQLSTILSKTMLSKGDNAAIAKYKELRMQYYGTMSYDFTEPVLNRLAQASLAGNKPDDALAFVKLNLEYYPKSAQSYVLMSQAHARKRDRSTAIKDLEEALKIDPENMAAKRQLDQLKSQPQ
jgi:hypothetical protein